jgi:hypothetical protein
VVFENRDSGHISPRKKENGCQVYDAKALASTVSHQRRGSSSDSTQVRHPAIGLVAGSIPARALNSDEMKPKKPNLILQNCSCKAVCWGRWPRRDCVLSRGLVLQLYFLQILENWQKTGPEGPLFMRFIQRAEALCSLRISDLQL